MSDDKESFRQEEQEVIAGESELLHDLGKGALAGLIAAVPVAIIAYAKDAMGLIPQIDLIGIMTGMTGMGWAGTGWVLLFAIAAVLGAGFASLDSHVSDATDAGEMARGALFGFLLWIVLMLVFIPLYDSDGFGMAFAGGVLATCLVFGVVMGLVYERMKPEHVA